jgi:hypothetical protein
MDELDALDGFDLARHGDRNEREFWPLLSGRLPSYEILWRRLIVPMTNRIDREINPDSDRWIRFRSAIPKNYEQLSMAHYSVFYFLGRASKRLSEETTAFEYPEDVFFLLHSVDDNFKRFMESMNAIGRDCGIEVFEPKLINQLSKEHPSFKEISDYRNVLLHNPILGRGVEDGRVYLPKWSEDESKSPLERVRTSWIEAAKLSRDNLISTNDLFGRLMVEVCNVLETSWKRALDAVRQPSFGEKIVRVLRLRKNFPLAIPAVTHEAVPGASGNFSPQGSNTNIPMPRS